MRYVLQPVLGDCVRVFVWYFLGDDLNGCLGTIVRCDIPMMMMLICPGKLLGVVVVGDAVGDEL